MRFLLLIGLIVLAYTKLYSQNLVEYKFYKNRTKTCQVEENKGKYFEKTEYSNDSTKLVEFRKIKNQKLIWKIEYRKENLSGIWHTWRSYNGKLLSEETIYGHYKPSSYYSFDTENNHLRGEQLDSFIAPKLHFEDKDITEHCNWEIESGLSQLVASSIKYPVEAQENGIQGEVVVQFSIDNNGQVGFVKIAKGVNKSLNDESFKIISRLPQFIPAKLKGKKIGVYLKIPVKFFFQYY